MKFKVNSIQLQKKLDNLIKVSRNSKVVPILKYFKVDLADDVCKITASDMEVTLVANLMPEEVLEAGSTCVSADKFTEIVKKLGDVTLTISTQGNNLVIKCKYGTYKIPTSNSEYFPLTQQLSQEDLITIPAYSIVSALNKTLFAAGDDEHRPTLKGVYFGFKYDKTSFVATDIRRISVVNGAPLVATEKSVIVPTKVCQSLLSVLAGKEEDVDVLIGERSVLVKSHEYDIYGKLIEGEYVNYNMVLNQSVDCIVTVKTKELIAAVDRAMIFSANGYNIVQIQVLVGQLKVSGEDIDFSLSAEEEVECVNKDGIGAFLVNGRQIIEILQRVSTEEAEISFNSEKTSPIVYVNPTNTEDDYLFGVTKIAYL